MTTALPQVFLIRHGETACAESFGGAVQLRHFLEEAQTIVSDVLATAQQQQD